MPWVTGYISHPRRLDIIVYWVAVYIHQPEMRHEDIYNGILGQVRWIANGYQKFSIYGGIEFPQLTISGILPEIVKNVKNGGMVRAKRHVSAVIESMRSPDKQMGSTQVTFSLINSGLNQSLF